jgi:DNA repair protein RadA/Sms
VVARAPDPDLEDPVEELMDSASDAPIPLSEVAETTFVRDSTGLPPLDHVLGGGLVVASVVLLASPPGIGKTSISLQMLHGLGHRCLYVTGEETREQVAATARRIGAASSKIYVFAERNLAKIFMHTRAIRAQTIVIDSIQKMLCEDLDSRAGTTAQLKECTARLVQYAKTTGTSFWLIGHVTSDGAIAGPKTIEHDVDVVLELEQGAAMEGNERILRIPSKNRFGPTNVVGRFELTAKGFVSVDGDGWDEEL